MDEDAYFADLSMYIDTIEKDLKVEPKEYERRLAICRECESLFQGMCRICGCYVELRAVMKKHSCPAIEKRW